MLNINFRFYFVIFVFFLGSNGERQITQVEYSPNSFWNRVLWKGSNETGQMLRDPLSERLLKQVFNDNIKKKLQNNEKILGTVLDPVWLWPQEPLELRKGSVFKGKLKACDLHLHNFKTVKLVDVEVQRDLGMNFYAIRIILNAPILWMTGHYQLTRSLIFGFIPTGGSGDFNIDLKNVNIGVIATLEPGNGTDMGQVKLGTFEVGISWRDVAFKMDGLNKGFNHMTDWTLNQLGVGYLIAQNQRNQIVSELENYFRGLFECFIHSPADGVQLCMRRYWIKQGWVWPWSYPPCP